MTLGELPCSIEHNLQTFGMLDVAALAYVAPLCRDVAQLVAYNYRTSTKHERFTYKV